MKLSRKQSIALRLLQDNITNEVLFGGAAGGGKSLLGCYWILKNCLLYPGTRWLIGRSVLKTLKETTIKTLFEVIKMQDIPPAAYKYYLQASELKFANGSEIIFKDLFDYPSDPNKDELGSLEITGYFIDEAVQVKNKVKNILKSRVRFKLDEYNLIPKGLYTSNPGKGWLYQEFYKPSKNNELPENKQFVQSLLQDNPFISDFYEENLNTLDSESKERLLNGNWDYQVEGLTFPEFKLKRFKTVDYSNAEIFAYCDVADQGIDYLCFLVGALIGENVFILDVVHTQLDSNYTIPRIISMFKKYNIQQSIFESNNQGLMYLKLLWEREPQIKKHSAPFPNTTNKHSRIIAQSQTILDTFHFKQTDDKEYNNYIDKLTEYRNDKKTKVDDAPDATAGLSKYINTLK